MQWLSHFTLTPKVGGSNPAWSNTNHGAVAVRVYCTVPTNTVPVPMTTGTVTDNGSVCTGTGLLRDSSELIYRAGKL